MQVFKGEDYKDVIGAMSDDYGKYFSNTSPFYDESDRPLILEYTWIDKMINLRLQSILALCLL